MTSTGTERNEAPVTRTGTELDEPPVPPTKRSKRAARVAEAASVGVKTLLVKIALLSVVDAISVYALMVLFLKQDWLVFAAVLTLTLVVNWIYFSRYKLPAKYLTPGLIFLLIFQIFVVGYSGYIAFTNYGTGHNSDKPDAINALIVSSQQRVPDSPTFNLSVVERLGIYSFLVTDPDGAVSVDTSALGIDAVVELLADLVESRS